MIKISAVFMDRDGVINKDSDSFITEPEQVRILPGAPLAVKSLHDAGFLTIIVSNQSGVGRGLLSLETLDKINEKIRSELNDVGALINAIYFCPHLPSQGCSCRKPNNGMLVQASQEFGIDLSSSYMIGDKPSDIACGESAGCVTILTLSGKLRGFDKRCFAVYPDYICLDLLSAAEWIIKGAEI